MHILDRNVRQRRRSVPERRSEGTSPHKSAFGLQSRCALQLVRAILREYYYITLLIGNFNDEFFLQDADRIRVRSR